MQWHLFLATSSTAAYIWGWHYSLAYSKPAACSPKHKWYTWWNLPSLDIILLWSCTAVYLAPHCVLLHVARAEIFWHPIVFICLRACNFHSPGLFLYLVYCIKKLARNITDWPYKQGRSVLCYYVQRYLRAAFIQRDMIIIGLPSWTLARK